MGAALCQLPERCVYKIEWGRAHSLSPLSLSFMHRVNCVVSKAHGASDEGSRRLGSRIWLQYWSKREQVRDRPTHSLTHIRGGERWAYIAAAACCQRAAAAAPTDGLRLGWWGAKTQNARLLTFVLLTSTRDSAPPARCPSACVFAERQKYIMLTLSAGWARLFLPQPKSAQPCTRQFWETHTWFFIYCLKSLAHKNCPWCLT